MATTAIAAKAAIKTIAESGAALTGYKTTWSFPTKEPTKKWLMLGEVEWSDADWATNRSRDEVYRIGFSLNVQVTGGTGEDAERAAAAAMKDFENAIYATPNLGVPGVTFTNFLPRRLFSFPTEDYFEGQFDGDIVVHARVPRT